MIKIARIDGDGIGKEVTEAGVAVLESLDLNLEQQSLKKPLR